MLARIMSRSAQVRREKSCKDGDGPKSVEMRCDKIRGEREGCLMCDSSTFTLKSY